MNKYYIDEKLAKISKEMNSFDDYKTNSATNEYAEYLIRVENYVNDLIKRFPNNVNEEVMELVEYYKDKYSEKLAFVINKNNRIEAMCPNIMITGAGNFPIRKKQKQNEERESFWQKYADLFTLDNYYVRKIETLLTNNTIYSDDKLAIEKLENKIADLEELQKVMKEVNAYYRKNKTLEGCEYIADKRQEAKLIGCAESYYGQPYPAFELSNNNQNIHRLKERLENLKKLKERAEQGCEDKYIQVNGVKVVEDSEDMRIKLLFNEIPNEEVREFIKHYGFRWSPKNKAWQRQLTNNGIYSTKKVLEKLKEMED